MTATDWSPLAEADPVPGDPWATQDLGSHLRDRAAVILDVMDQLKAIDEGDVWDGKAAEAFREKRVNVLPRLNLLAHRYERAAGALQQYCYALEQAQAMAADALQRAKEADEDMGRAQAALDRLYGPPATLLPFPVEPPRPPVPGPDWQEALEHSEGKLRLARRLLDDAVELRERAAAQCARTIEDTIDDDLKDDTSLWARTRRVARGAVERFPQIKGIATWVGAAAGVLGLLALIPPLAPLGAVAVGLGAVAFVLDTTLALGGHGDWTNVAIGAAGLALFGFGRALTAASRGTAGVAAARQSVQMEEVVARTGGLKGVSALADDGGRLTGAAARSRIVKNLSEATSMGTDSVTGLVPSWRNWRTALSFRSLELPSRRLLQLSDHAARLARIATGIETVASPALDTVDLAKTGAEAVAARSQRPPSRPLDPL